MCQKQVHAHNSGYWKKFLWCVVSQLMNAVQKEIAGAGGETSLQQSQFDVSICHRLID